MMNASAIAASIALISNSQYRARCKFDTQAQRLSSSVAGARQRGLKGEKNWTLEPLEIIATSRLAHTGAAPVKTMRALVPVRENARNFIYTRSLKLRHVKFILTLIEPQQRNPPAVSLHSFIYILRCRLDKSLIYNRNGFFRGRHEDPHHIAWMQSGGAQRCFLCGIKSRFAPVLGQ